MTKTVLVLGAGTGGIVTAKELRKKAGRDTEGNPVKIILFEKEEKNIFQPSLLWLMVGKRKPQQVYRSTKKLASRGVAVVIGEIEKVILKTFLLPWKERNTTVIIWLFHLEYNRHPNIT